MNKYKEGAELIVTQTECDNPTPESGPKYGSTSDDWEIVR